MVENGISIYEQDEPIFLRDGNAAYYLDDDNRVNARAKLDWVRRFRSAGRLLDVGANFGYFVAEAAPYFEASGIEPSRVAADWARTHLNACVRPGSIYAVPPDDTSRFSVVTMWDVIEHLEDPPLALERVRALLEPRGVLCLATPDMSSMAARVLGRHWHYLDLVQHVALFDRRNLTVLLEKVGFRVIGARTFGRLYRTSYVGERMAYFARQSALWRVASAMARPVLAAAPRHLSINLADVMGVAAEVRC